MKGSLILTEGRSGSNWLISLSNKTGVLGKGGEWFADWHLRKSLPKTPKDLMERVFEVSSTENGYFCIKLFPAHVHRIQIHYGFDLIKYLLDNHDLNLVRLTRGDKWRQAISYARGIQTQKWTSQGAAKREPEYDFELICRCFFLLQRSDNYWQSYCSLRQLQTANFVYEDLLDDPSEFVDCLAKHCGTQVETVNISKHSIQRDRLTEVWFERFVEDIATKDIVDPSTPHRRPKRSISNIYRLARGDHLKPYPYAF